jgi:hypothetical protein
MTKSFGSNALQALDANGASKERSNEPEINTLQTLEETTGVYTPKKRNKGEATPYPSGVVSLGGFLLNPCFLDQLNPSARNTPSAPATCNRGCWFPL